MLSKLEDIGLAILSINSAEDCIINNEYLETDEKKIKAFNVSWS